MGNYRLRLSELIPNAWFYKLRDLGKSRKQRQNASPSDKHHAVPSSTPETAPSPRAHHSRTRTRRSYHYSRSRTMTNLSLADTTSAKHRRSTKAVSSACSCRAKAWSSAKSHSTTSADSSLTAGTFSPEFRSDHALLPDDNTGSWPSPCSCTSKAPAPKSPELHLHPIATKPRKSSGRKTTSPGVRLRLSSPRVSLSGGRSSGSSARRSTAVVKVSVDPRRDFKESMVEMIVENNIRASKDLEELLACYLCLNSDEYHHIIIAVFKQIWLDLYSS